MYLITLFLNRFYLFLSILQDIWKFVGTTNFVSLLSLFTLVAVLISLKYMRDTLDLMKKEFAYSRQPMDILGIEYDFSSAKLSIIRITFQNKSSLDNSVLAVFLNDGTSPDSMTFVLSGKYETAVVQANSSKDIEYYSTLSCIHLLKQLGFGVFLDSKNNPAHFLIYFDKEKGHCTKSTDSIYRQQ